MFASSNQWGLRWGTATVDEGCPHSIWSALSALPLVSRNQGSLIPNLCWTCSWPASVEGFWVEQWVRNPWSNESVQGQHTGQGTQGGMWWMRKFKNQKHLQINVILLKNQKKRNWKVYRNQWKLISPVWKQQNHVGRGFHKSIVPFCC